MIGVLHKGVKKYTGWRQFLKEVSPQTAYFTLLFDKNFKVLINDGDSQEDSRARANRAEEVSHHG